MRRTSDDSEGSLDLLLDTICNMFGGIVLIAILLAIVSQLIGSGSQSEKPPDPGERKGGITKEEWEEQGQTIASLTNQIHALRQVVGANEVDETDQSTLTGWQAALAAAAAALATAQDEHEDVQDELTRTSNALAHVSGDERVSPPMEQTAGNLSRVLLAVRYGKLYAVQDVSRSSPPRGFDASNVEVEPGAGGTILLGFPNNKGQPITAGCEGRAPLRDVLLNVSTNREYLYFVVYPDSYAQFNYVKGLAIKNGFRYTWNPMESGDVVQITPYGSDGRNRQDSVF